MSVSIALSAQPNDRISLSEVIKLDIDGDGKIESISFIEGECARIKIKGDSEYLFGCGDITHVEFLSQLEWVDYWGIFPKQRTEENIFTSEGDIETRKIDMQSDGIYLMKEDDGLIIIGVLTFMNGKPYWIHKYC